MTKHTKRALDAAVDELKREGYQVLILMLQKEKDEGPATAMEVLCSETNDQKEVAILARTALEGLCGAAGPRESPDLVN